MTLIDIHRHLWDTDWFPPGHRMKAAVTAANKSVPPRDPLTILPRVGKEVYDPDGTKMIRDMDAFGIDVSVIQVLDWGVAYMQRGEPDSPTPIREINRLILGMREKYPGRVYGFMGVDPRRKEAAALLETAVKEWGAVGYKPYTPNGYYADDPLLFPLYRKCIDFDIPVLVHCGGGGWASPDPLERVAQALPDLKIIMGHANLQSRFESGAYWRALQIAGQCPNVTLDICDWQVLGAIEERNIADFWHVLDVMRNTIGAHRIVWGTDMPMAGKSYELTRTWCGMMLNLVAEAARYDVRFTPLEAEYLCAKNAARLIGLPEEVKVGVSA